MEAKRKRKPLSDCTNTTTPPSIKKPFLASALKNSLNDTNGKSVINSDSQPGSTANAAGENTGEVASANGSSVSVASRPAKSSRVSGTGDKHEVMEPSSVYSRRSTAAKRKSKGKEVSMPVAGSLAATIKTAGARDKNKEDGDTLQNKSCKTHHEKKKKYDEHAIHALPKEFIEEQNAYYAAVDEFKLEEEVVESVDQLE
ncbi:hypothetical protein KPL70_010878 [Citrus sinensis]|uniref:uncharacterized protein LOC18044120 n=1 Tax=Citrus clementina TaxID=85681 RepID=UPI0003D78A8B|nr:uncharacterized protein LOC18044120 [Citrus x clementina]XP_006486216.1 uncharacterized protein LOC102626629 [Citrus sinensis]KAH9702756.1 hypothetical protein KPL70_010878 [Citrus sinensis]GAY40550.1 hypothetical protein CUMW_052810 [Citrus unshiu]